LSGVRSGPLGGRRNIAGGRNDLSEDGTDAQARKTVLVPVGRCFRRVVRVLSTFEEISWKV
jgi:hypothetical protein